MKGVTRFLGLQLLVSFGLVSIVGFSFPGEAGADVKPASDGTGSRVNQQGNRYDVDGGTYSRDGRNLFHSLEEMGLSEDEIARFLSDPGTRNILTRVVGGNTSIIDGLIQVMGSDANFYLMNPAGVVFGRNARLDVPGSFNVTTATGIGFEDGWVDAIGNPNYFNLVGDPTAFRFDTENPGAIISAGELSVNSGETLALSGGTVTNTGSLEAEGGLISVTAVPGTSLVELRQPGQVVGLVMELPTDEQGNFAGIDPLSLAELLTTDGVADVGVTVTAEGEVETDGGTVIPTESGTVISTGEMDASNRGVGGLGGAVDLAGTVVGLVDEARVDVSGRRGGGTGRIGGDFQGRGTFPTAQTTLMGADAEIRADAVKRGDGGEIYIWADGSTTFRGDVYARGGQLGGDGGFVEVSGHQDLRFEGDVDLSAPSGITGRLLLDPENIVIVDGAGGANDAEIADGEVLSGESPGETFTIAETTLEGLDGNADVTLQASNNITINDLTDDALTLQGGTGNISFEAGGSVTSLDTDDTITANGRNINIQALDISLGPIFTNQTLGGGNVSLNASGDISVGQIQTTAANTGAAATTGNAGDISITSTNGNITVNGQPPDPAGFSLIAISIVQAADVISDAGDGGTISVSAPNGDIFLNGRVSGSSINVGTGVSGLAGDINLLAGGDIQIAPPTGTPTLDSFSSSASDISNNAGNVQITSTNGSISIGGEIDISSRGNGSAGDGGAVNFNAANGISLEGELTTNNAAISLQSEGRISINQPIASGGGDILVEGTTSDEAAGIFIDTGGSIDSNGGNISLTGISTGTGDNARGIDIQNGSSIVATGGNISLNGTSSGGAGVRVDASTISSENGSINLVGDSSGGLASSRGINIQGGSSLATSIGSITLNGNSDISEGISVDISTINSGNSNIELTGNSSGTLDNSRGINIQNGSSINSNGGNIIFNGATAGQIGIALLDSTLDSGNGDMNLIGNSTGTAVDSRGIDISGTQSSISSDGGNITFSGNGDVGSGVRIGENISTFSSNGGTVRMVGVSSSEENINNTSGKGIEIQSEINSGGGNVELDGTSANSEGISVFGSINSDGGNISLAGTSTGDDGLARGIDFSSNSSVTSNGGNVTFAGTGGDNPDASSPGIRINSSSFNVGSGSLSLEADDIRFGTNAAISGTGELTLRPATASLDIKLGASDSSLSTGEFLSIEEISQLADGFSSIEIGRTDSTGTVTLIDGTAFNDPVEILGASILIGPNQDTNWNITGADSGNLNDTFTNGFTFRNVGNLTGGTANDTVIFDDGASLSGTFDGSAGSLTVQGNDFDIGGLAGTDDLAIAATSNNQNIQLGGSNPSDNELNLSPDNIQEGFTSITIGSSDGTGTVEIAGDISFSDPTTIQGGAIEALPGADITGTDNASISLLSAQSIDVNDVTTDGQAINLRSPTGSVEAGNLNSFGTNGGEIFVEAQDFIEVEQVNSSGINGDGGNVTLDPDNNVTFESINAEGGPNGAGGDVVVTSREGFLQGTGSFQASNGNQATISTIGGQGNGSIQLTHDGGARSIPFEVGNADADNGTVAAITTRTNTIADEAVLGPRLVGERGNAEIEIITGEPPIDDTDPTNDKRKQKTSTPPSEDDDLSLDEIQDILREVQQESGVTPVLLYVSFFPQESDLSDNVPLFPQESDLSDDTDERDIQHDTSGTANRVPEPDERLELTLVTPTEINEGNCENGICRAPQPIKEDGMPVTYADVEGLAKNFFQKFTATPTAPSGGASNAGERIERQGRGLYQWLVDPLSNDLEHINQSNPDQEIALTFIIEPSLSYIPFAALVPDPEACENDTNANDDDSCYLVEDYSVSLMPSLRLTDTRIQTYDGYQILPVAIEEFERRQLETLEFPSNEVAVIEQIFAENALEPLTDSSLSPDNLATLDNLRDANLTRERQFSILHLATHASFAKAGEESFIYLVDEDITFDNLDDLGWGQTPLELLVLTACETAGSDGNRGWDADLGFGGIAHRAGARSVLGGLFEISDISPLPLTALFYNYLLGNSEEGNIIKAEALRQAQLAMINNQVNIQEDTIEFMDVTANIDTIQFQSEREHSAIDLSHPYYWGGFTMVGNPW